MRMALDNEVEPFVTENGEGTFMLTEEAIKVGDLNLEWQRARYDNAKLHEFLGHWIYQDQTFTDLARMSLPYIGLKSREPQYIKRAAQQPPEEPSKVAAAAAGAGAPSGNGVSGQKLVPNEQQQFEDQKIQREPARGQRDFFE